MSKLLQTLMDGFTVGSLYALIALGYTMVYGVLQFINFAHGDVFMLGAWLSLVCARAAADAGHGFHPPLGAGAVWFAVAGGIAAAVSGAAMALADRWRARRPSVVGVVESVGKPVVYIGAGVGVTLAVLFAGSWACYRLALATEWAPSFRPSAVLMGLIVLATAAVCCGLIGFTIERVAYRPLRKAPRLNVLITAIGVSLLLENVGQLAGVFGTEPQRMPTLFTDSVLATFAGVNVRLVDVVIIGLALVLMAALQWLIHGTRVGLAMRATAFDTTTAALMGVPVDRVISFTFIVGSVLAAAAGLLYASKYPGLNQPAHTTWILLGLKAFVAAVVGGIGNIRGAMLGGLLIGLVEFFGAAYLSPQLRDVYVFSLLILVLLVRPNGIMGRRTVEKV